MSTNKHTSRKSNNDGVFIITFRLFHYFFRKEATFDDGRFSRVSSGFEARCTDRATTFVASTNPSGDDAVTGYNKYNTLPVLRRRQRKEKQAVKSNARQLFANQKMVSGEVGTL